MSIKKIFFIVIIFAITSCGFQPVHLSKNTKNFTINEITEDGDKNINRKILLKTNLRNKNKTEVKYNLAIKSSKKNEVTSRDSSGNALTYKISIQVDIILSDPENSTKIFKQKIFNSSFSYNDNGSKFTLSQYIRTVESNLINKISKDIKIFLST
jgi:outer membrane lipopolysaccharide assembly protein LptE/RlpB